MFMECVIYLHSVSMDYFTVIHNKIDILDIAVLEVKYLLKNGSFF